MESKAYGDTYRAVIRACSPYVAMAPEEWKAYRNSPLPTSDGRAIFSSFTPYGGLLISIGAEDLVAAAQRRERARRLATGFTPEELESAEGELGISLKGRTLSPLGRPPSPAQLAVVIPPGNKSVAELYHGELPPIVTRSVLEELEMVPVREAPLPPPGGPQYISFRIPYTVLVDFCQWTPLRPTLRDVVDMAMNTIYRRASVSFPLGMRISLQTLEGIHPTVTYATVLGLSWQVFGAAKMANLGNARFAQIAEDLGWTPRRIRGSNLNIWFPGPSTVLRSFTLKKAFEEF